MTDNLDPQKDDEVAIFFKDENAAPYRMFGKFLGENELNVYIEGTVGEYSGGSYVIPKIEIKMMEITKRVPKEKRAYDEHWSK